MNGACDLKIEEMQCVGCAVCADVCPSEALRMSVDAFVPAWLAGQCNGCAICVRDCPTGAVSLSRTARKPSRQTC